MADNHDTPLSERFENALKHILEDEKLCKRLRYSVAVIRTGGKLSEKQALLLAEDIIPYLDRQGIVIADYEDVSAFTDFQHRCMIAAWNQIEFVEQFRILKAARKA